MKIKAKVIILLLVVVLCAIGLKFSIYVKKTSEPEPTPKTMETKQFIMDVPQEESQENKSQYIKFQDKHSMDWDFIDGNFLLKIAQYKGRTTEERAYTILVTLNRVFDEEYPDTIVDVVLDELYNVDGITPYDFEGIVIDDTTKAALTMVMYDRLDNSNGSTEYKDFE